MDNTSPAKQVILRRKEEHRILKGHPWVFSNEVQEVTGSPAVGDVVEVRTNGGKSAGFGFYHPHSLISVRLFSRHPVECNTDFFSDRISRAYQLRQMIFPGETTYRLVHSEADFLPGLTIDRYNDHFCVQILSSGMDARFQSVCDALENLFSPKGIIERNESPLRLLEQMEQKTSVLRGTAGTTTITEHGLVYTIDLLRGQKTGFYLDQRENRALIRRFARGASVLDCFCNEGGFALNAAAAGAASVLGIDASEEAVLRARENITGNRLEHVRFERADVFEFLKGAVSSGHSFDIVVLDPPSFTRSRKTVPAARKGYTELHQMALRVLRKGGILMSGSCSHHILPETFLDIIDHASHAAGRRLQQLWWTGASPDHPVLHTVPETRYLKFGVFAAH